jgi:hypothetical protein
MVLMVKGANGGVINEETLDGAHKGETEVLSRSRGIYARSR